MAHESSFFHGSNQHLNDEQNIFSSSKRFVRMGQQQQSESETSSSSLIITQHVTTVSRRMACSNTSTTSPPKFNGKKGACAKNATRVNMLRPYWNHNWTAPISSTQPNGTEFVPMLWSDNDLKSRLSNIKSQSPTPRRLLGFNEPDNPKQANMTVDEALAAWPSLEATGMPLISPSCVHPTGTWMTQFMQQADASCKRVDYIGVHWYGGISFDSFTASMINAYNAYGNRPLVLTEFATADWKATSADTNKYSQADVLSFMKQALPWLEQQSWIYGYAWFPFDIRSAAGTCSALFDTSGKLTPLGQFYASVRTKNPYGNQTITA